MRYPGGKSFIANKILPYFANITNEDTTFVDVFTGGLTMTTAFAKQYGHINKFWINDKDPGIAAIWSCFINWRPNLKAVIRQTKPTVESFFANKAELAGLTAVPDDPALLLSVAAKKIMIHQCSYSGLGLKGGVQGGNEQSAEDKITTNWNPEFQYKKINEFQKQFANCNFYENKCTNLDFTRVIETADPSCVFYLDPPYYEKGKQLYYYYFNDDHHKTLCKYLKHTPNKWVLSYDDCDYIKNLYSWAKIDVITNDNRIQMPETDGQRKANTKNELIITPE